MATTLPSQIEYAIILTLVAGVLVGALLLILGLRGRLVPTRGRCASCRHTLHDPFPPRCGECGVTIGSPGSIVWGEVRRRPVMAVTGGIVTVVALVASVVLPVFFISRPNAARQEGNRLLALDPTQLAESIRNADERPIVWTAMEVALASPKLTHEQAVAAAEAALDFAIDQNATAPDSPSTMGGDLLARILESGLLRDDDIAAIAKRAFGTPQAIGPKLVGTGSSAELRLLPLSGRLTTALSGVEFTPQINSIAVITSAGGPASDAQATIEDDGRRATVTSEVPGTLRVELEPVLKIVAQPSVRPRSVLVGPAVFDVTLDPIGLDLRVVDVDRIEPMRVDDPTQADTVRAAIEVRRAAIARDLDGARSVLDVEVAVTAIDLAALDFDLAVEIEAVDDAGHRVPPVLLGSVGVHRRGMEDLETSLSLQSIDTPRTLRFLRWIPEPPASARSVTLAFVPTDRLRSTQRVTTEIRNGTTHQRIARTIVDATWALPIRIENIELIRDDLAEGTAP